MAKKKPDETTGPVADPVSIKYVGPVGAESPRFGQLVPGRCYQESDPAFAAYLVDTHPDHWARA